MTTYRDPLVAPSPPVVTQSTSGAPVKPAAQLVVPTPVEDDAVAAELDAHPSSESRLVKATGRTKV
jgi:hypothetical protein